MPRIESNMTSMMVIERVYLGRGRSYYHTTRQYQEMSQMYNLFECYVMQPS